MKKTKRKKSKKQIWTEKDFVKSVWDTMKEQAEKNPSLHLLHARLEYDILCKEKNKK